MNLSDVQIGLLGKYWTPGKVKTRLAKSIGNEAAAVVYRAFVETLTERFADQTTRKVFCFSPSEKHEDFERELPFDWQLVPQAEGDLGERIAGYFKEAFSQPTKRVVLLGTDSPDLPLEYIEQAVKKLSQGYRLTLGPTPDGGYYLVATSDPELPIFTEMPWSSEHLWEATLARLKEQGWQEGRDYFVLPMWSDVDTREDLDQLVERLKTAPSDPTFEMLLKRIQTILPKH